MPSRMSRSNSTQESLRFHPVSYNHYREPAKDTVLPLSKPITTRSGKVIHEIIVPQGTKIVTSVNGYHRYVVPQLHMHAMKDGLFTGIQTSLGMMQTPSIPIGGWTINFTWKSRSHWGCTGICKYCSSVQLQFLKITATLSNRLSFSGGVR